MEKIISKDEMSKFEKSEFSTLVNQYMKRAYFSALGILGNHDDAMDASQEAFIKAYRNYSKFDKDRKFFTWYYKILKNHCLNMIRGRKTDKKVDLLECKELNAEDNTIENIEHKELKSEMEKALFKLSDSDREILILKEFENLSYNEIAELLDIPVGSVMSRLYYARKKLAKKLEGNK
ncbi:MAG: RNA polymerase sigma factor [Rhodothermaceae bacterium]